MLSRWNKGAGLLRIRQPYFTVQVPPSLVRLLELSCIGARFPGDPDDGVYG